MKGKSKKTRKKQDSPAPTTADDGAAKTAEQVKAPQDEIAALNDRLLRLQADFENFKKRTVREKNETYRRANANIIEELLPVLDSMGLAIEGALNHDADPALVDGFRLVAEQLHGVLAKFGLSPVDAEGQQFDPNLHEAVSHLPSDSVPDGGVIAQTRRGYMLGDLLLRAAQVVVSSGPVADEETQTADDGHGASETDVADEQGGE